MHSQIAPNNKREMVWRFETVLLIDDDPVSNFISMKFLKKQDLARKVYTASNGLDAVNKLTDEYSDPFPDLIMVDINMPVMNGFEFLDHYKAHYLQKYPDTMIVILTSSTGNIDREKATKYPFIKKYLTKPLDIDQLKKI